MGNPIDDCTSDPAVRVVLVDRRDDRRSVMRQVVQTDETYARVVGEASSAVTALDLLAGLDADAVILELQMPVEEGMEAIVALHQCSPRPRIIVCSFTLDQDISDRAIAAGADTCLRKPVRRSELRDALGNLGSGRSDLGDGIPPDLPRLPRMAPVRH